MIRSAQALGVAALAAWLGWAGLAHAQPAGEIVSLSGRGEYRPPSAADWIAARVKQAVQVDSFVRLPQADSKMSLLLTDESQVNLQGVTIMQLKSPEAGAPRRSILEFGKGTGRIQTKTPNKELTVRTPTGLAAIRGTEWLVEVADDGTSAFTVVEGEIELSNDLGKLSVGANEQGVLERGKPPSKRRVQNARERVQWVSAFTIEADRYAELRPGGALAATFAGPLASIASGELAAARQALEGMRPRPVTAELLLADIDLYTGRAREAAERLERARTTSPDEPRLPGLIAHAWLFADDMERARAAAARALAERPDVLETQLAVGEVARLDGDARTARRALTRATRIVPGDWRAWHALGQVHADRADPRRARRALAEADRLSPNNAAVLGELGLVEANAYALPRSRALLDAAIAARADDFAGWTGLGIARIKSGDLEGALEALLKATLIEPRYARAHIYLAVVYWQQGRAEDAMKELKTASVHDPRDPLPWQYLAMIESDLLRPGEALAAARESLARLPFVKSLDAVANNLRGSANLGAPLAQLGLEAWAFKNAQDSFDPLWAGSHLFLADRLQGKYLANSELFQGFLADPLAFGASNRFQPLVSRPNVSGTLAWRGARSSDGRLTEPLANVNGLVAEGRAAFFAEATALHGWNTATRNDDRADSYTVGIGLRPRDDLGFFFYGNHFRPDAQAGREDRSVVRAFEVVDGSADRYDGGVLYRPSPDTQLWLKGGYGKQDSRLASREFLGTLFRDNDFTTEPTLKDLGLRALHRYANGLELSAVVEASRREGVDFLERDFSGRSDPTAARRLESVRQDIRDRAQSFEAAARWQVLPAFLAELQVDRTTYEKTNDILVRRDFINQRTPLRDDHDRRDWSPRVGVAWRPWAALTVRAVYQEWLRGVATGSLKPTSTAGIPLDDRYVLPGGFFERRRVQLEWEASPRLLVTAFADRQKIDNLFSELIGVLNNRPDSSNLERLRNRSFNALASLEPLEGFPDLSRGELREEGVAVNWLATPSLALFAEGKWAKSENTGQFFPGRRLAFMPQRRGALGATFFPGHRLSFAAKAIWRGERFSDEANARPPLRAEWNGALQAYWESADKRWSIEAIATNLGAKSADESYGLAINFRF